VGAVPTGVVRGPDGAYYVGELTGAPFPRGGARVYRVVSGQRPEVYARGFTNIIDIAFDGDGNLYVLEIAHNSLRSASPYGALLRVSPSGATATVLDEGLVFPTSIALDGRNRVFVTNCGVCPGGGEVLEVTF
jgi:sugar lactone lactonase YvrE